MQTFGDAGETMGSVEKALHQKLSGRPQEGDITFRDESVHFKRGRDVGAFVPGVAGVAINVANGDVKLTFSCQNQVLTFAGHGNVSSSVSDTKGNTRSTLGVVEDTHPFTTREKKVDRSEGFREACELRCTIAAQCGS